MDSRLIVVNGGWRTGSTLLFNLARMIFEVQGLDPTTRLCSHPREVDEEIRNFSGGHRVLKCHVWAPTGTRDSPFLRVLHSRRDPLDVAGSFLRIGKEWKHAIAEVQRQAFLVSYHMEPPVSRIDRPLVVDYDYFWDRPEARLNLISAHLGASLSRGAQMTVLDETRTAKARVLGKRLPKGKQDEETLIQHQHVGPDFGRPGTARKFLSPRQKEIVKRVVVLSQLG